VKLAEALIERADLQKTIAQVKNRMKENAKVQEGRRACAGLPLSRVVSGT